MGITVIVEEGGDWEYDIDPYSAAVSHIMRALDEGVNRRGQMNGRELEILRSVRERLLEMDPDAEGIVR